MRWSDQLDTLLKIEEISGKTPLSLQNKPLIDSPFDQYVNAFTMLANFRNAQGRIELKDILAYAKEIGEVRTLDFAKIMSEGDRALVNALREREQGLEPDSE